MFYDHQLISKAFCSKEEKQECLELVEEFISLSTIARREGLLALDDLIDKGYDAFMSLGLRLIVDGTPPDSVEEILKSRIYFGDRTGKALLEQFLIYEGILSIQEGENPHLLKTKLLALLGESGDQMEVGLAEIERKMFAEYISFLESQDLPVDGVAVLDEFILTLDDFAIQRILREISADELAIGISGASGKVVARILSNMTFRAGWKIKEEMENLDPLTKEDILGAQIVIKEIYLKLREFGEI